MSDASYISTLQDTIQHTIMVQELQEEGTLLYHILQDTIQHTIMVQELQEEGTLLYHIREDTIQHTIMVTEDGTLLSHILYSIVPAIGLQRNGEVSQEQWVLFEIYYLFVF